MPGLAAASSRIETEVSGQPQPGWDIVAGYAYNDTRYLKAPVAQQGQVRWRGAHGFAPTGSVTRASQRS